MLESHPWIVGSFVLFLWLSMFWICVQISTAFLQMGSNRIWKVTTGKQFLNAMARAKTGDMIEIEPGNELKFEDDDKVRMKPGVRVFGVSLELLKKIHLDEDDG